MEVVLRRLVETFFPVLERTIDSNRYGNSESHQDDCRLRRNEPRTVQVPPQMGDWWKWRWAGRWINPIIHLGFRLYELNLFNTVLVQNMLLVTSMLNFWTLYVCRRKHGSQPIPTLLSYRRQDMCVADELSSRHNVFLCFPRRDKTRLDGLRTL